MEELEGDNIHIKFLQPNLTFKLHLDDMGMIYDLKVGAALKRVVSEKQKWERPRLFY